MGLRTLAVDRSVLVVVDVQERLMKIMDPVVTSTTIANIELLAEMFGYWSSPRLVTEQYAKGLGPTVAPLRAVLEGEKIIEKMVFSCWGEPDFVTRLRATGRNQIIVSGIETHICVLQTVLDLCVEGFEVFVPVDAVMSSSEARRASGLHLMERAGACCAPTESLLYQMVGQAGTDDFRKLVGLVKAANQRMQSPFEAS